jgi:hypothetical protein
MPTVPGGLLRPSCIITPLFFAFDTRPIFSCAGGPLLIQFAGSAFRDNSHGGGLASVALLLDETFAVTAQVFVNEGTSHRALVPNAVVKYGVEPGTHTFRVAPDDQTVLNGDDRFSVLVTEYGLPLN